MVSSLFQWFLRFPYLIRLIFAVVFTIICFGILIHFVEPNQFPTVFDGIWWSIITTSTIGYGDFVPSTVKGKIIAIFLIFFGAGLVAAYFVAVASSTVKRQSRFLKGTVQVKWKNHFIIVGWNERTKEIIKCFKKVHTEQSICLIDSDLEESPFSKDSNIMFVKGSASSDQTLLQANINEADLILVTSDPTRTEVNADMNTILYIVAIKGVAPEIYCIAEILTSEQIINAKRAGASEIIQSNKLLSSVMQHTLFSHGVSNALLDLVNLNQGTYIKLVKENGFNGHTFESACQIYLKEQKILIGLRRDNQTKIIPQKDTILQNDDELLIISHDK